MRSPLVSVALALVTATSGCGDAGPRGGAPEPSMTRDPVAFSFEDTARLLAQREVFLRSIPVGERGGLLDPEGIDRVIDDWLSRHGRPNWNVLSVHLGEIDVPHPKLRIFDRRAYVAEITGPWTGNCFYFFDAVDGDEFLGACFYPKRG
jgi:hypothetical protein